MIDPTASPLTTSPVNIEHINFISGPVPCCKVGSMVRGHLPTAHAAPLLYRLAQIRSFGAKPAQCSVNKKQNEKLGEGAGFGIYCQNELLRKANE